MLINNSNKCISWHMDKLNYQEKFNITKDSYVFSYYTTEYNSLKEREINTRNYRKINIDDISKYYKKYYNNFDGSICECKSKSSSATINSLLIKKCDPLHKIYNCVDIRTVSKNINLNNYKFSSERDLFSYIKTSKDRICSKMCDENNYPKPLEKLHVGKVQKLPILDKNYDYENCVDSNTINNHININNKTHNNVKNHPVYVNATKNIPEKTNLLNLALAVVCVVLGGVLLVMSFICIKQFINNRNHTQNNLESNNEENYPLENNIYLETQTNNSEYNNLYDLRTDNTFV